MYLGNRINNLSRVQPTADYQVKPEIDRVKTELEQEACDCISRADALNACDEFNGKGYVWSCIRERIDKLPSVTPQEPKTDYKAFAEWVAKEIFSDEWELNKDAFAEVACRKLNKLGIVACEGNSWILEESEDDEDDMTIQFKISKYLYKCLKKRIELNVASELDRLVDKGTVIEQEPSCSPKPIIVIDGIRYIAEEPRLKTVHKDGEVVIGGFKEIV